MTTPAAELGTVRFAYTDRDVLKGAGFMLAPGQFAVLVGQNGSGKSTIIKLLLGQIAPRGGCVQVCGERPAHAVAHGCVGYVPQQSPDDYRHFPLTVMEMVRTTAPGQGLVRRGRSRALCAARRAIAQAGLAGREDALVGELSGGQFQAALLARALVRHPQLLLLDESTSNLDDANAARLMQVVRQAVDGGAAALLVTHDLARLPQVYDRCLLLEDGLISEAAPADGLPCDRAAAGIPASSGEGVFAHV